MPLRAASSCFRASSTATPRIACMCSCGATSRFWARGCAPRSCSRRWRATAASPSLLIRPAARLGIVSRVDRALLGIEVWNRRVRRLGAERAGRSPSRRRRSCRSSDWTSTRRQLFPLGMALKSTARVSTKRPSSPVSADAAAHRGLRTPARRARFRRPSRFSRSPSGPPTLAGLKRYARARLSGDADHVHSTHQRLHLHVQAGGAAADLLRTPSNAPDGLFTYDVVVADNDAGRPPASVRRVCRRSSLP